MTINELSEIAKHLCTLRFMMATALSAIDSNRGVNQSVAAHMGRLAELEDKLRKEVQDGLSTNAIHRSA